VAVDAGRPLMMPLHRSLIPSAILFIACDCFFDFCYFDSSSTRMSFFRAFLHVVVNCWWPNTADMTIAGCPHPASRATHVHRVVNPYRPWNRTSVSGKICGRMHCGCHVLMFSIYTITSLNCFYFLQTRVHGSRD
jgi:hypothetical protein